ncbi:MAG: hypothetical protein ACO3A4_10240 [Silvanigrellaceae bacterium]
MRHTMREFLWIALCLLTLSLLPWWQAVIFSAVISPFLLRLTERGFTRRLVLLFLGSTILMLGFHASHRPVSIAVSQLLKLPHFAVLAVLSAGVFALVFALAAESVLWMRYSLRKTKERFATRKQS